MWSNLQFPVDLVTFTEEILNGKLIFLCSDISLFIIVESIADSLTPTVKVFLFFAMKRISMIFGE